MRYSDKLQSLIIPNTTRIVMLIMDGLGGLPRKPGGETELESACTPNLDALASGSSLGLTIPVGPGITPGSGPGHLALFGYDPLENEIGRGAMEALGVDFELGPDDLAARGNFCTLDTDGKITDRRAGRIATEISQELVRLLETIKLEGMQVFARPVKEHRFAFILRAPGLHDALSETDPQRTGVEPLPVVALDPGAEKTADYLNQFILSARKLLAEKHPAIMILLRGFARLPSLPPFQEKYGLKAAAIANHGMYRGVARLVGMQVLDIQGHTLEDEFSTLERYWENFDFFYLHVKKTDTFGEMGDFDGKVRAIEEVDACIPRLMALKPDVVIVGGDHSSPSVLKAHSWHPVPVLLYSSLARVDGINQFGERACAHGSLGILPAMHLLPIALASAQRIAKYGA
jgi:2,3-bisphosphoglycerate-independent phosphoglycerate mutase